MNYKILNSNLVFEGKVFDIRVDDIIYNSGNSGIREVVVHNGGAVVLPITNEGKIVFVKQFRYPFEKYMLELPAGKLETNEDPQKCAERELEEETGYTSNNFSKLGAIATTPGFCSEILHIYLAENLRAGSHNREEGEYGMEIYELTLEEVKQKIISGEIYDSKTICGISYYLLNKKN
ncbi:MAG: NUDIX hydrolase [Melioribacteraceae bacterium]|nr:NUDIX hydrolase [Melioribacteraceae bacterium]MDD3557508.1 NUDIX hydrolase [Melioribacteraceae bacterium]